MPGFAKKRKTNWTLYKCKLMPLMITLLPLTLSCLNLLVYPLILLTCAKCTLCCTLDNEEQHFVSLYIMHIMCENQTPSTGFQLEPVYSSTAVFMQEGSAAFQAFSGLFT